MSLTFQYTGRKLIPPRPDGRERIYVYDRAGGLINDPFNTMQQARGLTWRTGLPGGMWDLSFSVPVNVAEEWVVKGGYRMIVRRGLAPLWDGRVEDIGTDLLRAGMRQVLGLGWWQQLRQRYGTYAFTSGTKYADDVLRMALKDACPNISLDYSKIQSPGLNIVSRTWTRQYISQIVADLLIYGDSQTPPRQWYFALWPTERPQWFAESSTEILTDPGFETSTVKDPPANPNWSTSTHTGAPEFALYDANVGNNVHAGRWAARLRMTASGDAGSWQTALEDNITESVNYTYDYYITNDTTGTDTQPQYVAGRLEFDWYTAADAFVSTTTATLLTGTDVPTWTHEVGTTAAPATAAKVRVRCYCTQIGGTPEAKAMIFDDIHLYKATDPPVYDTRPRAYFWPRDITAWDYEIRLEEISGDFLLTKSTENLVNNVIAEYGTSSVTAASSDATSIAAYDQRDYVLSAGSVSATVAAAARDLWLEEHKDPVNVASGITLVGPVRKANNGPLVHQSFVRAGDRIKIMDLPSEFSDFLFIVQEETYDAESGAKQLRPESPTSSVDEMLAQALG